MSSQSVDKGLNTAKKASSAIARLEGMEATVRGLVDLTSKKFNSIDLQLEAVAEVINAVTDLVGTEQVQTRVRERATEAMQKQEVEVNEALKTGQLVYSTEVTDRSVVLYKETLANGEVRHPGKFYKTVWTLPESARAFLKTQKVGSVLSLENGAKIEVVEVYDLPEPVKETAPVAPPSVPTVEEVEKTEVVNENRAENASLTESEPSVLDNVSGAV